MFLFGFGISSQRWHTAYGRTAIGHQLVRALYIVRGQSTNIRRADRISTIQNPHHKNQPITTPPSQILKILPNKRIRSISCARLRRHNSQNQSNDDENSNKHRSQSSETLRQNFLSKQYEGNPSPSDDEEANEDLPSGWIVVWMVDAVHSDDGVGAEQADVGGAEDPG